MANFRQVKNGFVNYDVGDGDLMTIMRNLKQFIWSGYSDYNIRLNPLIITDILKQTRLLVGQDFRAFLMANYNRGIGTQAGLVREVVNYLSGQVGYRSVNTAIVIEENKIKSYDKFENWGAKTISANHMDTVGLSQLDKVNDYDFYRLCAGLSPELLARMFLVIGGENIDVGRK